MTIHQLPYARKLAISVAAAGSNAELTTAVTEGKEKQFDPVAVAEFMLVSDGVEPVRIRFKDPLGEKGIWLNAFELSAWHADLLR